MPLFAYGAISVILLSAYGPIEFQRFGTVVIVVGIALLGLSAKAVLSEVSNRDRTEDDGNIVPTQYLRFHARELVSGEVFLVVIGTLQTGYGDLFHCWFNGNGWTSC